MNLRKFNQGLLPSGGLARSSLEDENQEEDWGGEEEEEEGIGRGGSHRATGGHDAEAEVFISIQPPIHPSSLSTLSVSNVKKWWKQPQWFQNKETHLGHITSQSLGKHDLEPFKPK